MKYTDIHTLEKQDAFLERLWGEFEDIPIDPDTETIEEEFLGFPAGTSREDIWKWFDERYSKGVYHLLYDGDGVDRTDEIAKLRYLSTMCFECRVKDCVFNHNGECCYALVHEEEPGSTDESECLSYTVDPASDQNAGESVDEVALRPVEVEIDMDGNLQKQAVFAILNTIDSLGFKIHPYEEDGEECGFEIEDWTPNGVDMVHFVDLRKADIHNPFDITDKIRLMARDFDPDEVVWLCMEDSQFRATFTYRQAVEEFENWKQHLDELTAVVSETLSVYRSAGLRESECSATDFKIADWNF